jgi:diguanylate cyclase (GGDEF)-like protein/PAS domain S-box-containing protein
MKLPMAHRFSDDQCRAIADDLEEGIVVADELQKVTFCNAAFAAMLGCAARPVPGDCAFDFVNAAIQLSMAGRIEPRNPGSVQNYQHTWQRYDGRAIATNICLRPTFDAQGRYNGSLRIVKTLSDLSGMRSMRDNAERARNASAAVYSAIQRVSLDGILLVDSQQRIISYNQQFIDIWRVPPESIAANSDATVLAVVAEQVLRREDFVARVNALYARVEESSRDEISLKDGRTLDRYSAPVNLDDGTYLGRVWFFRDITEHKLADSKIRESASQFQALVEQQLAGIFIIRSDGTLAYINPLFSALFGYRPSEVTGRPFLDVVADCDREALGRAFAEHLAGGPAATQTVTALKRKDGGFMSVLAHASIASYQGAPALAGILVDITERQRADELLQASEQRFRAVSDTSQDAIVIVDSSARVTYWNLAAEVIFGYSAAEVIGKSVHDRLVPPRLHDAAMAGMREFASTGRGSMIGRTEELTAVRKDGTEFPIEISVAAMLVGAEWHAVATVRDITERKRNVEQISHSARHDNLTGLANRTVFVQALQQAIAVAQRGGAPFAILYLDLDHFKDVNDTLGHPVGDLVLTSVAERLGGSIRDSDTVARFGGDEFALIQSGISGPLDAVALAEKLLRAISLPLQIYGNEIRSGASIGIAVYGADSLDAETLLSHADVALYRAKREGRGTYRFFTEAMDVEVRTRVTLGTELRDALARGQFLLEYQPQIDVDTGRFVGIEALIRWRHPSRGLLSPAVFIPVAEQSGLVIPLGRWILLEACSQMKQWIDAGIAPPLIAVNVSGLQFRTPLEFEEEIAAILTATELPAQRLELELTETVLMEVSREHNDALLRLRSAGHRIAIDDFGTGYSSLEYLARFPVDRIKIAQSFIADLTSASSNPAIVRAAIGLAHELNLDVVVEGVETAEQLRLVRSWGCRKVQGYYFSEPLLPGELTPLLRAARIARKAPLLEPAAVQ